MKNTLIIVFVIFIAMQFFQVEHTNPTTNPLLEINAPQEIKTILKKSCFDCHSNEVKYPWYSNIAPISWMISRHVNDARTLINFSTWEAYTPEEKEKKIKEVFRAVYAAMPLSSYLSMHEEAQLTKEERAKVREWIGYKK
jgi:uncharacterized membrane protein